jgi:hypothetical protein
MDASKLRDMLHQELKYLKVETEVSITNAYYDSNEIITKVYFHGSLVSETKTFLETLPGQNRGY